MTVITSATLLTRRIAELQRRRDALADKQDSLRHSLPEWTFAPLKLVGMTADEIRTMMTELSEAERAAGLDEIEKGIERLDSEIEDAENQLLATPAHTLDAVQAVLDLAISRLRATTSCDPNDVFYDYGDARVLFFLDRAADDLRGLLAAEYRVAS